VQCDGQKTLGKVFHVRVMKAYKWNRGTDPLILNFGTRCRWVVNISPGRSTPGKGHPYPLNGRLGGSIWTFWRR